MSYWRDCKYCGQKILMTQNDYGIWQPLEPDGTGRHECYSGADDDYNYNSYGSSARSWSINDLEKPLTYFTNCWWCGAAVFFHSNGNGDAVLFDSLGWPWQVHTCWEEYVSEQDSALYDIEESLDVAQYNGTYYTHMGKVISPPQQFRNKLISVSGYVADNEALYDDTNVFNLSYQENDDDNLWTKLMVCVYTNELYPFVLPQALADQIEDYSFVKITGRWLSINDEAYLVTKKLKVIDYPNSDYTLINVANISEHITCYYCGATLKNSAYGLDAYHRFECENCASLRRDLNTKQFLNRIKRIAKYRLRLSK